MPADLARRHGAALEESAKVGITTDMPSAGKGAMRSRRRRALAQRDDQPATVQPDLHKGY